MVVHCLPLVGLSAPLLLWLGGAGGLAPLYEYALGEAAFARERRLLCVNVEIPAHGEDVREGEPRGVAGWAARLAAGEDICAWMAARVTAVVSHLIDTGRADPACIILAGGSRTAFMALHCAAADPRIGAVIANKPMIDLLPLNEPKLMAAGSLACSLDLTAHAEAFAGKRLLVVIGAEDERVGTDKTIEFARLATRAGAEVDLHVVHHHEAVAGANGHNGVIPQSVELTQAWLDRSVL